MEKIKIAVLGLGTLGQGVITMLNAQGEQLAKNAGCPIELGRVLEKYLTRKRDIPLPEGMCTNRWEDILNDDSIQIIVETIGGIEPARTYILQALQAGKSVVTANKDLLAAYGQELFRTAREAKRDLYFEASVGGAIPIIGPLRQSLIADRLSQVMGIINGTTNYVLTKMEEENSSFEKALQEAQDSGFAEADPTADIEGHDAARKAAILATLAFHSQVNFNDVYAEGISKITKEDMALARNLGYRIKLLAICRNDGEVIEARVHPALIPLDHPLSGVRDIYNAIFVKGPELGETMFYGVGTGQLPSASAVLGDVVAVARNIRYDCQGRLNMVENRVLPILPIEKVKTRFFLRLLLKDEAGALAQVTDILGQWGVSIARLVQIVLDSGDAELVFVTHEVPNGQMQQAVAQIRQLAVTKKVLTLLRVEDSN
ncbi:MAG: homoserine dehydrogenase [Clostridiales bacterium]